ncbi:MAG: dihydrofolate reductase [Gammaproteobacteria bacterium]|nr:dihydrofolate reductase [Gammaproteobacteria bacterium]
MARQFIPAQAPGGEAAAHTPALELVLAVAENDVIGRGNGLPWQLSADLRRFKALTLGKHILMGRRTYQSIGKALPGRTTLVLTRSADFAPTDCTVVGALEDALLAASGEAVLMVVGGAEIYRQCLPHASRIHLTLVHARVEGDTFFSGWRDTDWRETFRERHEADDKNTFAYSFVTLERGLVDGR